MILPDNGNEVFRAINNLSVAMTFLSLLSVAEKALTEN
jgi:hypothetical protein